MVRSVLVTGAGGFIGLRLLRRLVESGYEVAALDRDGGRLRDLERDLGPALRAIVDCDLTDATALAAAIDAIQPRAVVHLAAEHLIPRCESNPGEAVSTNVIGLVNTLRVAGSAVERVVFASTADVYAPSTSPHAEDGSVQPSSVYGASKFLGERLVGEWARQSISRQATCVRIFNVYGPGDGNPHVITEILQSLADSKVASVGNLHPKRDYIYVDDVADVLSRVLAAPDAPPVVNAGTGSATSVSQILEMFGALCPQFAWRTDESKVRRSDRPHLQADTTTLRTLFPDLQPRTFEAGLRETVATLDGHKCMSLPRKG